MREATETKTISHPDKPRDRQLIHKMKEYENTLQTFQDLFCQHLTHEQQNNSFQNEHCTSRNRLFLKFNAN